MENESMAKILIIYATHWGSTKKLAEAIASGAQEEDGMEVIIKEADSATREEVLSTDALILGSPVHMGSMDWRVKKFIDEICSRLWMEDKLNGKVGAVFATGGGYGNAGGGCELTMLSMMNNLVELGLIIIPLPKNTPGYADAGLQWGPYGRSMGPNMEKTGLTEEKLQAARHHGTHVARAAKLLKDQNIFS
jgi:NAD(P)H dehydrogenase (quinone)